jgi:membrane protein DedA with SNARE-associated domain
MLPFVRAFTSIVAGLVRIPALRFGVLSLIGTVIYATVLSVAGYQLGHAWNSVSHGLAVVGYVLFAIVVVAIVAFVLYRLRQFRRESAHQQAAGQAPAADAAPAGDRPTTPPAGPRRPGRHRSDAEV